MAIRNSFLPADIRGTYKGVVVAVGGPPHSGKSVFLAELYRQLLARRPSGVFLQRACPDGEGMWSAESDPVIVKEIRRKGKFSSEFMTFTLKAIENLGKRFPIVLIDLGGIRSAENAEVLARSTHLLELCSAEHPEDAIPWTQFAEAEGCTLLARFVSALLLEPDGTAPQQLRSKIDLTSSVAHGLMLQLHREGGAEPYGEVVSQFADWLITEVENR